MTEICKLTSPLPPNARIGIIGGGQLGRMLASSAARLGFQTTVLEPGADCPASQMCNSQIEAPYDDTTALEQLVETCDVVTYEFENITLSAARFLDSQVPLYPPSKALEVSQDRLLEKQFLQSAGLKVAPFHNVESDEDLFRALADFGGGILKTRRFGYDGKGQHVLDAVDSGNTDTSLDSYGPGPFVLESRIDFINEFSIIAARAVDGSTVAYDPSTNVHEGGILRRSIVPAKLALDLQRQAMEMAVKLLDALDYVGVVGVEFFQTEQDLLINEFAPRVHNSGHWTREACITSQFEQHIRAVTGHALGSTLRNHDCEMINLLGDEALNIDRFMEDQAAQVTLYGKQEARKGRKMGHVTRILS
ncbi:MAG: 5-(carboxyamino)imidazole ribonucleotide synthase [Rhizobiaceae bacterium]